MGTLALVREQAMAAGLRLLGGPLRWRDRDRYTFSQGLDEATFIGSGAAASVLLNETRIANQTEAVCPPTPFSWPSDTVLSRRIESPEASRSPCDSV